MLRGLTSPDAPHGHSKEEVAAIFSKVIEEPGGKASDVSYLCDFPNEAFLESYGEIMTW